jgi:RNA polymerase nonessential primary-like sigma factor
LLTRETLQEDLERLLAELSDKEAEVIRLRFGLGNDLPKNLAEIGAYLELSRERVCQIKAKD